MSLAVQIAVSAFLLAGMVFFLGGSIGLIRFPDAYCRMHALGKPITLGMLFCLIGAVIFFFAQGLPGYALAIAAVIFIFLTAPVATHMISKASYHRGIKLCDKTLIDDLADPLEAKKEASTRPCDNE